MSDMDLWDMSHIDQNSMDAVLPGKRVLIVGGGKMGAAILDGFLSLFEPGHISVCEPDSQRRAELETRYPAIITFSHLDHIEDQMYGPEDWIVLAVKPQIMGSVLDDINRIGAQAVVISVAVGISITSLQESLPLATVIRIMPNLPVMVGEGMILLAASDQASDRQIDEVAEALFELGDVSFIKESDIDICAAISGSGPAYFALIIDAMEKAGANAGLPANLARDLALVTMMGTADMLDMTGEEPVELARAVQSPGGTTEQAVAVLEERGMTAMFDDAVKAAIERAAQLRDGA